MGTMCVHTHTDMCTHSHTNSIHTPERKGRERGGGGGRRVGGGGGDEGGGNLFKRHLPAFREIHILLISI